MTTPSARQSIGLPVHVWKPSIVASGSNVAYTPEGTFLEALTGYGEFGFQLQADGGYWQFSLTVKASIGEIDDWIDGGLGRHVEVYDEAGVEVWEGFVNGVSANIAGLSVTRGPLMDIVNRCSVSYAKQEIVGAQIVTTQGLSTTIADNEASKLKYGIFERVLSAGAVWDDTAADDLRDATLAEQSLPETSKQFSNQPATEPSVTIECLGYINFLKNYIYNASDVGVGLNVSTTVGSKIVYVIDGDPLAVVANGDPNGLFDAVNNGDIYNSPVLESRWEDQNTDAHTLIQTMVAKGDGADGRCVLGVYAGRKITFAQIPTVLEYNQRLSDPTQGVTTVGERQIFPWNVLPGKWLLFTDFLIGKTIPASLREDPRAMFIERVAYSTPWGLRLDGGKVKTVRQKLAKLGLGV